MKIFIVNGRGGSGKTTFEKMICRICSEQGKKAKIFSTIEGVKNIAKEFGWDGEKELKDRKMLSDLKDLLTRYNDYPHTYIAEKIKQEQNSCDCDVVFIDSREPDDIKRWCDEYSALSILIDRGIKILYNNHADDNVDNYSYDIYISNKDDLKTLEEQAQIFYNTFIVGED